MSSYDKIAIMIPVYNGLETLPQALKSLLAQTYPHWECVIVNDGSTDGTRELLDALSDHRFKVIHLDENKGRPNARQVALDHASGKYLAFLDADDFYHPEKLEKQLFVLEENPDVSLVSCANACYDSGFQLLTYRGLGNDIQGHFRIGQKNPCTLRTSMMRLKVAKTINFDLRLKHAQDNDFTEKYLHERKYQVQSEILYYYSEFDSVTIRKILKTRKYELMYKLSQFSYAPASTLKESLFIMLKWSFMFFMSPFLGADFYLKKRGKTVSKHMENEFNKLIKVLSSINLN